MDEHAQIVHQVEVALETSDDVTTISGDDKENATGANGHRSSSSASSNQS